MLGRYASLVSQDPKDEGGLSLFSSQDPKNERGLSLFLLRTLGIGEV